MQTLKKCQCSLLAIGLLLFLFSLASCNSKESLPVPEIVNDSIILSGVVVDERNDSKENPLEMTLIINNPISGKERGYYTIPIDEHGQFELKVPVETNPSLAIIRSSIGHVILVCLVGGEKNFSEIRFDKEGKMDFKLSNSVRLNAYDMTEASGLFMETEVYCDDIQSIPLYDKSYDEYISIVSENIDCRIAKALAKYSQMPEPIKEYLKQELMLMWFDSKLFSYNDNILYNYRSMNPEELWDSYIAPPEPGRHYYHFLKDLRLNEQQNLYSIDGGYNIILDNILSNDTLAIQEIDDTPIETWIKSAAEILGDLVGFEKGFFYDQLAIRSYIRQFEDLSKPLTERQKENIENYFSNKAISAILFRENEKIEALAKYQSAFVINSTPDLPNEQLFEGIDRKSTRLNSSH